MKHFLLSALFLFFATFFAIAAPQEDGTVLDGTGGYTVKDFRIDGTSFTVSAWVKLKKPEDSQIFVSLGAPGKDWTLYSYNGKVRMLVENAPLEVPAYSFAVAPLPKKDEWTHYLGTYNGKTVKIYKDGKLADEKPLPIKRLDFSLPLYIGTAPEQGRCLNGETAEVNIWKRSLSEQEVAKIYKGEKVADGLITPLQNAAVYKPIAAERTANTVELLNQKDDGYRGIWYHNQSSGDEYVYKYSGGLGTYPANHYPFAVYAPEVDKTFFCYGGTEKGTEQTLLHEVSYYDHKTGTVPRPTIILDKKTNDAHDNPVMNIDKDGYIWVFSTSHGTGRPSFIHKSKKPFDVSEFEKINATKIESGNEVPIDNFSYLQIYYLTGKGFAAVFTTYDKRILNDPAAISARTLVSMSSPDGVKWSEWKAYAGIQFGHYQSTGTYKNEKIGSAFNYHPNDKANGRLGLNWRTNLYYIETKDMGKTWQNVQGETLDTPLREIENKALVHDYDSKRLNVYVFDVNFDIEGKPIIAYLTSKGYESGPKNDPRQWYTAYWTGKDWQINPITVSDNNYDFGSLYIEENNVWRIIGTDGKGPQEYNTGGEVAMYVSTDCGKSWKKERQLTAGSPLNHCYPRRPVNANPDFYAMWATGHGRQKSESTLYFCNKKGDVFELPRHMDGETAKPVLLK